MIAENLYPLLSFVPAGVLAVAVKAWRWFRRNGELRPPTEEKYLPSPGDSCRKKIDELDEEIGGLVIYLFVLPPVIATWYLLVGKSRYAAGIWSWAPSAAMLMFCFVWLCCRYFALVKQRENWRLGFNGERLVGQILNRLMLEGCQVFHDFSLASNWNLDHIVVAPSGVYAIETKMRSKGPRSHWQKAHEVIYDGDVLQFPRHRNTEFLTQARRQAELLATLLKDVLEGSHVQAVVTLPGWYVLTQGSGEVLVLNPRMLQSAILGNHPAVLSTQQIMKIARRLEREHREDAL